MSDAPEDTTLTDTEGSATITTTLAAEGNRWLTVVTGGANHGFQAAMDKTGDPAVQHARVIELVKTYDAAVPPDGDPKP